MPRRVQLAGSLGPGLSPKGSAAPVRGANAVTARRTVVSEHAFGECQRAPARQRPAAVEAPASRPHLRRQRVRHPAVDLQQVRVLLAAPAADLPQLPGQAAGEPVRTAPAARTDIATSDGAPALGAPSACRAGDQLLVFWKRSSTSAIRSSSFWATAGSTECFASPACLVASQNRSWRLGNCSRCGGLK